ncbi:NADH oxidoreductase [Affinibrenneria salicis]|uniref:NADH oxidoreductase n=1 Tax=Affinibrenneria salicis TaxID=2590031 RepID=A0A5J5G2S7_9GAMM|nr:NADH oxidoreductase [Affinibrenneria salicis]KAA9001072.1 NADH oxidoreductase [Affinibrenneria salicis]
MAMPTPQCPNRMQVHSVRQETPDVWTLSLINHDFYPYLPGQHALVSIAGSAQTLRPLTLSSSPGLSRFITLTVRRLANGIGSRWLTRDVQPGDELWLSDARGEFTCVHTASERYLMLAAGCGVTPIIAMCRWLLTRRPQVDIQVIYNVRDPQQIIFADEWQALRRRYRARLTLTLIAERGAGGEILPGRLTPAVLRRQAPDIAGRAVMICGPAPYMAQATRFCLQAGVAPERLFKEYFHAGEEEPMTTGERITLTLGQPPRVLSAPAGSNLLTALESHRIAVQAACRTGVCGSCRTRILHGRYTTISTSTLTEQEISQGYVLACSCRLLGDVVLA